MKQFAKHRKTDVSPSKHACAESSLFQRLQHPPIHQHQRCSRVYSTPCPDLRLASGFSTREDYGEGETAAVCEVARNLPAQHRGSCLQTHLIILNIIMVYRHVTGISIVLSLTSSADCFVGGLCLSVCAYWVRVCASISLRCLLYPLTVVLASPCRRILTFLLPRASNNQACISLAAPKTKNLSRALVLAVKCRMPEHQCKQSSVLPVKVVACPGPNMFVYVRPAFAVGITSGASACSEQEGGEAETKAEGGEKGGWPEQPLCL